MNILFFLSHQPNPRFIKQLNFLAKKNAVSLVFFERRTLANLNDSIDPSIIKFNLGQIPNASSPIKRLWVYFKVLGKIKGILNTSKYDLLLINNIDVLILYLLSKFRFGSKNKISKIAIEISDLRGFVFGNSFNSKIIRFLERKLYQKYIDKLIVTSKKYYTYHFEKFYTGDVFILENKLLSKELKECKVDKDLKSSKMIIGIVGLLLRKDEYVKLFETYKNNSNYEIHIHGIGQYESIVKEYAANYDNIIYFGPYNAFTDTARIYNSLDVIYLVYDIDQVSLNNRLALPNKLYECMYYQVPLICSKGTYLEELVIDLAIGTSINYKEPKSIENAVLYISKNDKSLKQSFLKLDQNMYIADNDYIELDLFLNKCK